METLPPAPTERRVNAMNNRLWFATILATTPILAMTPVAFPAGNDPGCISATAGARKQQREFMSLMRRRDDAAEMKLWIYAVPRVRAREVKQVSDETICAKAARAYASSSRTSGSDRVHVLHVGGRFVVSDEKRATFLTFDSTFAAPIAVVTE